MPCVFVLFVVALGWDGSGQMVELAGRNARRTPPPGHAAGVPDGTTAPLPVGGSRPQGGGGAVTATKAVSRRVHG